MTSANQSTDDEAIRKALPPPTLEDHEYELWGQNVRADFYTAEQMVTAVKAALERAESITQPEPRTPEQALDAMVRDAEELGLYDEPAQAQEAPALSEAAAYRQWISKFGCWDYQASPQDFRQPHAPCEALYLGPPMRLLAAAQAAYELLSSGLSVPDGKYCVVSELAEALAAQSHPAPPIPEAPAVCPHCGKRINWMCHGIAREAPAGDKR